MMAATHVVRSRIYLAGEHAPSHLLRHLRCEFLKKMEITSLDHAIVVDGGVSHALKDEQALRQAKQIWFVGDGDSANEQERQSLEKKYSPRRNDLPVDKDVSDFGAALDSLANERAPQLIEVVGGLGGPRADHALLNLFEIDRFVSQASSPVIVVCEPGHLFANTSLSFNDVAGQIFSILRGPAQPFAVNGAVYEGELSLTRPSHGLSNKVSGSDIKFELKSARDCLWLCFPELGQKG